MSNPYAPPSEESFPVSTTGLPKGPLYSAGQMAWATFLGAPIAGSCLLAMNYRRLGNSSSAGAALFLGLLATVVLIGISLILPDRFPSFVVPAAYTYGMYKIASKLQRDSYLKSLNRGGMPGSSLFATAVGIVCAVVIVAALFGILMIVPVEWLGEDF